MGTLGNILSNLLNFNDDTESGDAKPCKNCPSTCELYPDSCELCKPFKEKLIDQLYDVEHLEEFQARYEIVDPALQAAGTLTCPCCGGPNPAAAYTCEYCEAQLRESSGKIQVSSAKDIPDPIQLAQDTIFERRKTVCQSTGNSTDILEGISQLLSGKDGDDFGERMANEEIEQTAESYGVSVSAYLQGLDNGKYLTASAKKLQQSQTAAASVGTVAAGGAAVGYGAGHIHGHAAGAAEPPHGHPHGTEPQPRPGRMDGHSSGKHGGNRPGQNQRNKPDSRPAGGRTQSHNSGKPGHASGGHGRDHAK